MQKLTGTNEITIIGTVKEEPTLHHTTKDKNFYAFPVSITRSSGTTDEIIVMVEKEKFDRSLEYTGEKVSISGHFHSYTTMEENGRRNVSYYVTAKTFELAKKTDADVNDVYLKGYICRTPYYKKLKQGREVSEVTLAIPRPSHGSDYIKILLWGINARLATTLEIGTQLTLKGRLQSRVYQKSNGTTPEFSITYYEVSVQKIVNFMSKENAIKKAANRKEIPNSEVQNESEPEN